MNRIVDRIDGARRHSRWWALAAMTAGAILVWFSVLSLVPAKAELGDDLGASAATVQWILTAYTVALGGLLVVGGRIGDLVGRRKVLLVGTVAMVAFSVMGGLVHDMAFLIVDRALMGAAGALVLPATLSIVTHEFHPRQHGLAVGIWAAGCGGGEALGLTAGAQLAELGWEWIFFVNVPLGVIAGLIALFKVGESRDPKAERGVDVLGVITISAGLVALILALDQAQGNRALMIALLCVAAALLVGFFVVERLVRAPLIDVKLFGGMTFLSATTMNLIGNIAYTALSTLATILMLEALGFTASMVSVVTLAATITMFTIPVGAGRLVDVVGPRIIVGAGMGLMAGSLLLASFVGDVGPKEAILAISFGLMGVGLMAMLPGASVAALDSVPRGKGGAAAGIFKMASMVGASLGLGLSFALAQPLYRTQFTELARREGATVTPRENEDLAELLFGDAEKATQALAAIPGAKRLVVIADQAFTSAFATSMRIWAAVTAVAFVISLLTIRKLRPEPEYELPTIELGELQDTEPESQ